LVSFLLSGFTSTSGFSFAAGFFTTTLAGLATGLTGFFTAGLATFFLAGFAFLRGCGFDFFLTEGFDFLAAFEEDFLFFAADRFTAIRSVFLAELQPTGCQYLNKHG
jgi:hypothetical protein